MNKLGLVVFFGICTFSLYALPSNDDIISKDALVNTATQSNPTKLIYVKDTPVLGYQITSDRFEDIPEEIRNVLGAVDKTKYTAEYLRKNIGSVIALQMNGDKPDFYIIGKDTYTSKYAPAPIDQVAAKNAKYFNKTKTQIPSIIEGSDPHLVGMLKTTPTEMIKMSDLGYSVGKEVKIESPWGEQTKPSGSDAYLVWDDGKKQYYMVNSDAHGRPINYVESSPVASTGSAQSVPNQSHGVAESPMAKNQNPSSSNSEIKIPIKAKEPTIANADNVKVAEATAKDLTPDAKRLAIEVSEKAGLITEAEATNAKNLKFIKLLVPSAKGGYVSAVVAVSIGVWQTYEACRVQIIRKGTCSLKTIGTSALKTLGDGLLGYLSYAGIAALAGTTVAVVATSVIPLDVIVFKEFAQYAYSSTYSGMNALCRSKDPSLEGSWVTDQCQTLSPLQKAMLARKRAATVGACKSEGFTNCDYYYTHEPTEQTSGGSDTKSNSVH